MFETHPIRKTLEGWAAELPGSRWFVVGGAVRDALLGRGIKDVDVLVAGVAFENVIAFLEARGSVDDVGRTFGVLKFVGRDDGLTLDVALPRRERPAGTGGARDVETESDPSMRIEDDLARRDFTINAMAWEAAADRLIDPEDGRGDLEKKSIRAVGDPSARFAEDYTRILRGLRFAVQLGFGIEPATREAMLALMPRINDERDGQRLVPYELVARELLKSFAADPSRTAEVWEESGALALLAPELSAWPARVREALERLTQEDVARVVGEGRLPITLIFGLSLAHLGPEGAGALAERLKLASAGTGLDAALARRLAGGGDVALYKELGLKPLLDGAAVMRLLGLSSGPDVGKALDLLIDAQAKGTVGDPAEAGDWLKTHWQ